MNEHKATCFASTKGVGINRCGKSDWPYFHSTKRYFKGTKDIRDQQYLRQIDNIKSFKKIIIMLNNSHFLNVFNKKK